MLDDDDIRLTRAGVRSPIELRPDNLRPDDPSTWFDGDGRMEYVDGRLLFTPPYADIPPLSTLFRHRRRRVELTPTPPSSKPDPVRRPAKVARQLALAHHLQAAIDRGAVADQTALARKLSLTRARVTQLFDLLILAADLQEQVLALEAVDGAEPMAERTLRAVAHAGTWAEQWAAWEKLQEIHTNRCSED